MSYTKTNWVNGETAVNRTHLNKIEDELELLDTAVTSLQKSTYGSVVYLLDGKWTQDGGKEASYEYTVPNDGYINARLINSNTVNDISVTAKLSDSSEWDLIDLTEEAKDCIYVRKGMVLNIFASVTTADPTVQSQAQLQYLPFA